MTVNVLKTNEKLQKDDNLREVIEALGFNHVRDRGDYYQFPNLDGDNRSAISVYKQSLHYVNYTRNDSGSIYNLIMFVKKCSFPAALEFVAKVLHLNMTELSKEPHYPFGGFYRKLVVDHQEPEVNMKTYGEDILDEYKGAFSEMFFDDHISFCTQAKYGVGYDIWSNRITIPEYTFDGKLCGIMGRLNDRDCAHEERWLPIVPCSRNLTLFGYHRNYEYISKKNLAVIFESEKSTMQLNSFGSKIGLSSCGCHLSSTQVRYLKGLMVDRLVLAYDEGLDEEYIREEAKKLQMNNQIINNRVGYIYDKQNDILKVGSKSSPSDLGRDAFCELMKKKVVWL